ncbi:substrate-binding domain-containing protein [Pelagibacterium mangrovi]|uniref:substrate-binding domain-containing protein n=1 Tax=Pelagibacterium mangrovi TaxID=3119828 RepID=UPI002FC753ED
MKPSVILTSALAIALAAGPVHAQAPITVGPNGEAATPVAELELTDEQVAQLQAGDYTAAFAWHELYDWSGAVAQGAKDEFARLGIDVVAETTAGFDSARQQSNVETTMALSPSILISLPVDPAAGASTYAAAIEGGAKIVFIDNAAAGFVHGQDYVTTVSADLVGIGEQTSEAMATALNGEGKIGYIFHDAEFHVTNLRDSAFKYLIENEHPGIEIVAEAGMADPARIEDIATAMLLQHPEITGLYVPWAEPAAGVLSVLRQQGRTDVKIITIDLNEPAGLDMVQGGSVAALIADEAYNIGVYAARAGAASLLGEAVDPFLVVDALIVTKDNVAEGWQQSLHRDAPESVLAAQ